MNDLKKEISYLKANVAELIQTVDHMKKAEMLLKKENSELKSEIDNQKSQIRFLGEKKKIGDMASVIDPNEREDMRSKIRELVKEIDGCIEMLNG